MNRPDSIGNQLTREAHATRPAFSESLHQRVMASVRTTVREPATPRITWPRYAAAAAILLIVSLTAVFTARYSASPSPRPVETVSLRQLVPVITLHIAPPAVPDIDREARRTLRRVAFAAGQLLEAGPIPIVINDPSRE